MGSLVVVVVVGGSLSVVPSLVVYAEGMSAGCWCLPLMNDIMYKRVVRVSGERECVWL